MELPTFTVTGDALWERMDRAVERIRQRLERTVNVLEGAGIDYAIVGGHAVRAWVSQVDEAAVRTTKDVDILIRREDLPAAIVAMEQAGFVYRHVKGVDMFLDGPTAKAREAVHIVFAGEKVREDYNHAAPDVDEAKQVKHHQTITLDALVKMKLNAFRDKDRMHLRDMIDVGLLDSTWTSQLPPDLAARLQELLDDPE